MGVDAPDAEAEVVKAQREALAAREVRRGRAEEDEESRAEAGRLRDRGWEEMVRFVQVS